MYGVRNDASLAAGVGRMSGWLVFAFERRVSHLIAYQLVLELRQFEYGDSPGWDELHCV